MEDILDDQVVLESTLKGTKNKIEFVPVYDDEKLS